jgi:ABC-2 type transport system permease protein
MMFGKIAAFEFRYQLRQPLFWIVGIIFLLLTFGWVTVQNIHVGGMGPGDHRNGPFAIANVMLIWTVFYMFVTTAFVANIVVRDDETGYGPIIRSTRIGKFDYLYGRFLGAFGAVAVSFLAVPLGFVLGGFAPWVDPETLGPLSWSALINGYLFLALPNILLTAALFFAVASVTRSLMWTYVGVIVLLVLYVVAGVILGKPEYEHAAALYEPFGTAAYGLVTKYWTASERNSQVPPIADALLYNRLLILGLSAAILALAYALFRFQSGAQSGRRRKRASLEQAALATEPPPGPLARRPAPRFDAASAWAQLRVRTRFDMGQVFGSPAYIVLLVLGLVNACGGLWFATEDTRYGGVIHPVTRVLIPDLIGSFGLIPIIIAVFYAGELVWRERDRKTHEIIDATPLPDWAFVAPKTLAIALVMLSTVLISVLGAMLIQLLHGYTHFEIGKYLLWYVIPMSLDWTLLAILAVFLQVVSPHKFVGWGLMVLLIISRGVLPSLGAEDHLYSFGMGPGVPLSDMNGQGRFWIGAWWFRLYWSAFCGLLLIAAYGLWRRGTETRMLPRLARLPHRLMGKAGVLAGVFLVVFVGAGAFIGINTHRWNDYRTELADEKWQADYEKALIGFQNTPQPQITAVKLDIDIHPHEPRLVTKGVYTLVNKTDAPLREVHVLFDRDTKVLGLSIEGAWAKTHAYDRFNYRIFAFDSPMVPGETRTMAFTTEISQKGFKNRGNITRVVDNGTFVNNADFAPFLGFDRRALLTDRTKRRKYGLPPERRMPKLGDPKAAQFNYLRHDSDWVMADITLTTDADQTAIAPGDVVSRSTRDGRTTTRFASPTPIMNFFSVQSARYQLKTETYKGVQLAVYYDAQHAWNVERMLAAQKATLDYAQANFSPYQFHQVRYLEFPDYAQFAQSFAGTIPWSEGLFFIADYKDPEKIDMVTYVGAHEIGHQWWAHQVIGADEQGSTTLSETLAQYTALMVMKRLYGPDEVRKFLKYELDSYLRARGTEALEELPLARVEDQGYIHYRKGSLVMYRLADEIGEDAVNRALRNILQSFAFKGAPYPTSRDLEDALRAEAPGDKQQLITDLFDNITLYDLKATGMTANRRPDGRYDVSLTVEARKLYADGKGKETAAPLHETMEVGLFLAEPGKKDFTPSKVLLMSGAPIHTGRQVITLISPKAPKWGGIDPYNILIDRNSDDNLFQAP